MVVVICFLMLFASFAQLLDFVWITYVGIGQAQRIRDPWSSVMFIFFVFKIQQLFLKLIENLLFVGGYHEWVYSIPQGWSMISNPPTPSPSLPSRCFFPYDLRRLIDLHMHDILFFLTNFGYGKTILFQAEMCFLLHYWASFLCLNV